MRAGFRQADGSIRDVLIDATGMWEQGRLVHSRWFVRDISRRVELEREILYAAETERQKIGQDIHDGLFQQLTGIEFFSQSLVGHLVGSRVDAHGGSGGKISDFLFDDASWTVHYAVIDSDSWLSPKKRIVPVQCLEFPANGNRVLKLAGTYDDIMAAATNDLPPLVRRQIELCMLYGWPFHLPSTNLPATAVIRSARELRDYMIEARDGKIGVLRDCVVDRKAWSVRFLIVRSQSWWFQGKEAAAPASLVGSIDWSTHKIVLQSTRQALQKCPRFRASRPLDKNFETNVYSHFASMHSQDLPASEALSVTGLL